LYISTSEEIGMLVCCMWFLDLTEL
jgi:hypothetical protein